MKFDRHLLTGYIFTIVCLIVNLFVYISNKGTTCLVLFIVAVTASILSTIFFVSGS